MKKPCQQREEMTCGTTGLIVAVLPAVSDVDETASVSSTVTANAVLPRKEIGPESPTCNSRSCSIIDHEEDFLCDDFSVKTHLDSVTSLPQKKRSKPQQQSKQQRKANPVVSRAVHVGFDMSSTVFHECEQDMDEYNVNARWYGPSDYKQFKLNVVQIVKTVFKAQQRRLRNPHSKNEDEFSYSDILENMYNACFQMEMELPNTISSILSKQEQKDMVRIYRTTVDVECCLGLERLLVQRIGQDRSELRSSLFGIIQDLQTTSHEEQWSSSEVLCDNIFQISLEVSRPARLFAQHLASAQATSVQQDVKRALKKITQEREKIPRGMVVADFNNHPTSAGGSARRNSH